jgi:hypothetical protein
VVLGDGEHHNAADAALGFLVNCGRFHSLRLHSHAQTEKNSSNENLEADSAGRTSARLFRSRRSKEAVIGRAAGEPNRSLKKLNQACDPSGLVTRATKRG